MSTVRKRHRLHRSDLPTLFFKSGTSLSVNLGFGGKVCCKRPRDISAVYLDDWCNSAARGGEGKMLGMKYDLV